jgi:NhaP-type Na+/H+ or K+/H+ antiporter
MAVLVSLFSALFGVLIGLAGSFVLRLLRRRADGDVAAVESAAREAEDPSSAETVAEAFPAGAGSSGGAMTAWLSVHIELILLVLFAGLSYVGADAAGLSGVMSIFFAGITLAQCGFYSLSAEAQVLSRSGGHTVALLAETLAFAYVGISAGLGFADSAHTPLADTLDFTPVPLIVLTLVLCVTARMAHVFPLLRFSNYLRSKEFPPREPIPLSMQTMLAASGLRGPISFLLSFAFPGPAGPAVRAATLTLVFVTVLVGGGATETMLRRAGMDGASAARRAKEKAATLEQQHQPTQTVDAEERKLDSAFAAVMMDRIDEEEAGGGGQQQQTHHHQLPQQSPEGATFLSDGSDGGGGGRMMVRSDSFVQRLKARLHAWWHRPDSSGGLHIAQHWFGWPPSQTSSESVAQLMTPQQQQQLQSSSTSPSSATSSSSPPPQEVQGQSFDAASMEEADRNVFE